MSAELTDEEIDRITDAVMDDVDRRNGYVVLGPGGTDGQTPTVREAVESIVAARVRRALEDAADAIRAKERGVDDYGAHYTVDAAWLAARAAAVAPRETKD